MINEWQFITVRENNTTSSVIQSKVKHFNNEERKRQEKY